MSARRLLRFAAAGAAIGLVVISALAATNVVSASRAGVSSAAITVDNKKPKPACNGITVTNLFTAGDGGNGSDLVLGTAAGEMRRGNNGNDCIVGGGGNDDLRGNAGTDVCIGGPGTDVFAATCETQIQ